MTSIFYVHSVGVIGGAERVTLAMITGLKDDYDCHLLCPSEGNLAAQAEQLSVKYHHIDCQQPEKSEPISTSVQFLRYWKLLSKHRPVLVHTGDLLALRSIAPVCSWLNIPVICHVHFPYEPAFINWGLSTRFQASGFIYCSKELRENVEENIIQRCTQAKHVVIHNGVDTEVFTPKVTPHRDTIRRIGIVANLQQRKGHEDFLEMAKILLNKGYALHFDIIGGDILQAPREPTLKHFAASLGITEQVTFHGQLSSVTDALANLDILVCASHEEAFPISILEAMACGKAIVSTNVNGIPEALSNGEDGILVPPHQPQALAEAVEQLINNPSLCESMQAKARQTVVDNFSQQAFITKLRDYYKLFQ